ncbi:MAG: ROK family protein [Candidatus Falkowbacteria bacterium]
MAKQDKNYTIGIDIGGTKMNAALFDLEEKQVIADYKLATPKDTLDHFMIMLNALVEPLIEKAKKDKIKIKGVGLGIAGVLNYEEKKVLNSPNIPLINGIKIPEKLEEKINLEVKMDNDTNCFTRAEVLLGAGQKYKNVYGVIIGTGIGGAWFINNKAYNGAHGGAGEPGAIVIDVENGLNLEEVYHKLMQNNPSIVANDAYKGDELSTKIFEEVGKNLGVAFANIVNIIDPEIIIIGGGVAESSDLFLGEAKSIMKKYILSPDSKKVKVVRGKLGEHAGAIGAALLYATPNSVNTNLNIA